MSKSKTTTDAVRLKAFFERLMTAPERHLLLDYDGTIAPFQVERMEARPYDGIVPLLEEIRCGGTDVVIVSGRPSSEVVSLLGWQPHPDIWGCHGFEHLTPSGNRELIQIESDLEQVLDETRLALIAAGWSDLIEVKPGSVPLHWRRCTEAERERMRTVAGTIMARAAARDLRLSFRNFDGGLELRATTRTKGRVVEDVLKGVAADAVVAFLGDDLTDEDAFAALGDRGLKALVRSEWRPTLAEVHLMPPEGLFDFLDRWLQATKAKR